MLETDQIIRFAAFAGVLSAMLAWEEFKPWRRYSRRWGRRLSNIGLAVTSSVLLFAVPILASGTAIYAQKYGIGLFNVWEVPSWLAGVLAFLALDLLIWGQHLVFHKVPMLWRLHRVHHSDTDFDTTTGLRFHPIEIVLSMGLKMGAVLLLGAPVLAVLVFEIALNAITLFNHTNVSLPGRSDRWLRRMVVTPHMHRVHHSTVRRETDSNYGFNLPWWDWLFGTYRAAPAAGEDDMEIGLNYFRKPRHRRYLTLLWQPVINRKERRTTP